MLQVKDKLETNIRLYVNYDWFFIILRVRVNKLEGEEKDSDEYDPLHMLKTKTG